MSDPCRGIGPVAGLLVEKFRSAPLFLALFVAATAKIAFASGDEIGGFRTLGVVDGLPDSNVEAMVQDARGFVWIATRSGLVRHEGARLRSLDIDADRPGALPGNNVMTLKADRDGSVWAAVEGHGVVQIGPDLQVNLHLKPASQGGPLPDQDVWSITQDCDGALWFAHMQGGLSRYVDGREGVERVPQNDGHGLAQSGFQMHLELDSDCRLWLVQSNRLGVLDADKGLHFQPVLNRADDQALMTSMRALGPDRVLLQGSRLSRVLEDGGGWVVQEWFDAGAVVVDVVRHSDGWLSISTFEGLVRWHPELDRQIRIGPSEAGHQGLASRELFHLLLDREGGLWINKARSGLAYLPPTAWAFRHLRRDPSRPDGLPMRAVYAVLPTESADQLWVAGRTQGLHKLDLQTGTTQPASAVLGNPSLDDFDRIHRLAQVDSRLLVGWTSQIDSFDLDLGSLSRVFSSRSLAQGTIRFVAADSPDHVWLATHEAGLYQVNLSSQKTLHFGPDEEGAQNLPASSITAMTRDESGRWWLAAEAYLLSHDSEQSRFLPRLRMEGGTIRALTWRDGQLWVANDRTLSRWRETPGGMTRLDSRSFEELVPGGRPFAFHYADDQSLWLLLTSGLLRIDAFSGAINYVGRQLGLDIGEILSYAFARLPDGRLALGGSRGLALLDPEAIKLPSLPPAPIITQIRQGETVLPRNALTRLEHWQRDLYFDFSSPSFIDPERLRYRIRLLGHQNEWESADARMSKSFHDLSPGQYRFEVQVGRPGGAWAEASTALAFDIAAPLWRRPLAYLAYGLVLLGFTFYAVWLLRRSARRKRGYLQAREDRRVAQQADQAKSDFLAVMSHEMRTPLHGVLGMLDLIQRRAREPQVLELLSTVQRSGRQLKRIVDDALDLSRIEANQLTLDSAPFELLPALEQVVELFAPMAASAGLDLRVRFDSSLSPVAVGDRDRLIQVIGNLLSNAIKFTRSGAVEIELREAPEGTLRIRVADSGPGINERDRARLFKKFQQLDHPSQSGYRGSGLGLAITRELIHAMGGQIELISRPLRGACFEMVLPNCLMPSDSPIGSTLLNGICLDSLILAPDRRLIHRLARRWGFSHRRSAPASRDPADALLVDPRAVPSVGSVDGYAAFFYLHTPFVPTPQAWRESPLGSAIEWPITEQRLIRALLAWTLSGQGAKPPESSSSGA